MKSIGLALVFMGCCLFGFLKDSDDRSRLKELEQFGYLFELLKGEIDYQLTPMAQACKNVAAFGRQGARQVFLDFAQRIENLEGSSSLEEMWQKALRSQQPLFHLKESDYKLLESFGGCCGYLDKNMQTRNLDLLLGKIEHERKQSEKQYEKTGRLNRSLGIVIGAALVIFLL